MSQTGGLVGRLSKRRSEIRFFHHRVENATLGAANQEDVIHAKGRTIAMEGWVVTGVDLTIAAGSRFGKQEIPVTVRMRVLGDVQVLERASPVICRQPCMRHSSGGIEFLQTACRDLRSCIPSRIQLLERGNRGLIRRERDHLIANVIEVTLDLTGALFAHSS